MDVSSISADLSAEQQALDAIVSPLDESGWATPTASPRWTVADQIGHLAFFDHTAVIAITDPDGFRRHAAELVTALTSEDPSAADTATLGSFRAMTGDELLSAWRANRRALAEAATTLAEDQRVIWYGPSMGAKSFLTARLMEVWAHGQDVVDALGAARSASDRLAHIVRLGVITRGWSYANRGLEIPAGDVRVELVAPSGADWIHGPADADEVVRGSAEDFCLVVTQRRHIDDTNLSATPMARDWMLQAQAFAGPPTDGPLPSLPRE